MARMHSRAKGRAGSKKPMEIKKPFWMGKKAKEIELLIAKLAKEGKTQSMIGIILRDSYGIPDIKVVLEKSISELLKEKGMQKEIPEDIIALMRKVVHIKSHMEDNRQDMVAKRGLLLTESKIKRLVKYYKITGRLPEEWKYDPEKAKMYIE